MISDHDKKFKQDEQLASLLRDKTECTFITTNGVQLKGSVERFDSYVVLIRMHGGKQSLIYKHALSTIIAGSSSKS